MKNLFCLFVLMLTVLSTLNGCICGRKFSGYVRDSNDRGISNVKVAFSNLDTTTTYTRGFYSKRVPRQWRGSITPLKDNYSFAPEFYTFTHPSRDPVSNLNFTAFDSLAPPDSVVIWNQSGEEEIGPDSVRIGWRDNASNEHGYIIRRSIARDTTKFVEVGRVPPDSTQFILYNLRPATTYKIQVLAYHVGSFETSGVGQTSATTPNGCAAPDHLIASFRTGNDILLTWKDYMVGETGFKIERDGTFIVDETNPLPENRRYYLDNTIGGATHEYYVWVFHGDCEEESNDASTTGLSATNIITKHTKNLEVDNQGGGAGGWSHFNILGFDQLRDGHLQVWVDDPTDAVPGQVFDGDDGDTTIDFTIVDPIELYNPSSGPVDEQTAKASNLPLQPVTMQNTDIEVQQFTYQQYDNASGVKNWIVVEWTVINKATTVAKHVKLAFFMDADAGGDVSNDDFGDFQTDSTDPQRKFVFLRNGPTTIGHHIGMAVVPDGGLPNLVEGFQITNTSDPLMPSNKILNANRPPGPSTPNNPTSGDEARRFLFENNNRGKLADGDDLAMTLICNLGTIAANDSQMVRYVIAAGENETDFKSMINAAITFAQGL